MPRFQPTFRDRLRLFFAVIVIIPMIGVAVVLFQLLDASDASRLDSRLSEAQTAAVGLYVESRRPAATAARAAAHDAPLASALQDPHPPKGRAGPAAPAKRIRARPMR